MLLQNNKITLIYGLDDKEKEQVFDILKGNCKVIDESMGKMKIRDIINGLKLEVFNSKLPKEKLILFNNFEDEELKKSIEAIKPIIEPKPIFAIVTNTSIGWTFKYLLEHLLEEKEWHRNHSI